MKPLMLRLLVLLVSNVAMSAARPSKEQTERRHVTPQGPLKKVVFAHRHCARTQLEQIGNQSCGVFGCGMCTPQGELMLRATGESFRTRYGSILPSEYLMANFKSYSDGAPRTQQSASAFLKGLFAFNASYTVYPAINSDYHHLIDPWSCNPTYSLRSYTNSRGSFDTFTADKISDFISIPELVEIMEELDVNTTLCQENYGWMCLKYAYDFSGPAYSEGRLTHFPVAMRYWPQVSAAVNFFGQWSGFGYQHHIESKDGFFAKAGYPAHPLLDAMHSSAGAVDDGVVLTEFSGHDTTLMPLYAAMGNWTSVYPAFATSVVFEVYSNPQKASDPFVIVKTALPGQLPGAHELTWFDYNVTCKSASSGEVYASPSGGCPLSDLVAFAETRRGTETSVLGGCYAFPQDLVATNCTTSGSGKDAPPADNPWCREFRSACPLSACGTGFYMAPDFSCHPL